jgi:hypothetical protein
MLSIVLSLAIATFSVSAQMTGNSTSGTTGTTPSISPECQALLSQPALETCGSALSGITGGTLPSAESIVNGLDSFCSKKCSDALDVLIQDLSSPACASLISGANTAGLPSEDIPAVFKVLKEALCLKDGTQYCASTLTSLLGSISSSNAQSVSQNQTVICSKCLKLEAEVITRGLTNVSTTLQQIIQPQLQTLTDEQKKCPSSSSSSSAMGISVLPAIALALGMVML